MTRPAHEPNPQWNPHAAVASWIVPGLGHWILGLRRRGVVLCISILSLWLGGILIGGISVLDRADRAEGPARDYAQRGNGTSMWFFGQALIAPSIVIQKVRANMFVDFANLKIQDRQRGLQNDSHDNVFLEPTSFRPTPPYEPSIGRVAEQGVLFTALAGLLNLLAMIDVLYCDPQYRRDRDAGLFDDDSKPDASGATAKEAV